MFSLLLQDNDDRFKLQNESDNDFLRIIYMNNFNGFCFTQRCFYLKNEIKMNNKRFKPERCSMWIAWLGTTTYGKNSINRFSRAEVHMNLFVYFIFIFFIYIKCIDEKGGQIKVRERTNDFKPFIYINLKCLSLFFFVLLLAIHT